MGRSYQPPSTLPELPAMDVATSAPSTDAQNLYGNAFLQSMRPEDQVCRAEEPVCRAPSPDPVTPQSYVPPAHATDEELYAFYADIARRNGNLNPLGPHGEALDTVLGLRGVDIHGRVHPTENRREANPRAGQEGGYDDTLVILHPDGTLERMPYSSHPFQNHSGAAPDANGDGSGDVATIRPGEYFAQAGESHAGDAAWHLHRELSQTDDQGRVHVRPGDDHIPAWRDTDHDFKISAAERAGSEGRLRDNGTAQTDRQIGDYANGVLFHQIRPGVPTDSSIACQVMPHPGFQGFKADQGQSSFNYVLIDANGQQQAAQH